MILQDPSQETTTCNDKEIQRDAVCVYVQSYVYIDYIEMEYSKKILYGSKTKQSLHICQGSKISISTPNDNSKMPCEPK